MPTSYKILVYRRAAKDIDRIFSYIAKDSPQNAAEMVERILNALESLRTFPHRTIVEMDNPDAPLRSLPVPPYVVFFRVFDAQNAVKVLHVRHGARRRPKRL